MVEAELARLIEENNELRARAGGRGPARIEEPAAPTPAPAPMTAPPPPVQQPREDDSARASRMLALATETADRYVNEAKSQADQMLTGAKTNSDRLMSDARMPSTVARSTLARFRNAADASSRGRAPTKEKAAKNGSTGSATFHHWLRNRDSNSASPLAVIS